MSARKPLELIFTPQGTAELCRGDDVLWASDEDDDFREDVEANEFLDADMDAEKILNYLMDNGTLTEDEAAGADVISESEDDESGEVFEGEVIGPDD